MYLCIMEYLKDGKIIFMRIPSLRIVVALSNINFRSSGENFVRKDITIKKNVEKFNFRSSGEKFVRKDITIKKLLKNSSLHLFLFIDP